jgi:uncharacterized protein (TIGR02594 family)
MFKWLLKFFPKQAKATSQEVPKVAGDFTPEVKLTLCERAFATAYKELGVSEIYGEKHNPRILEYHKATDYGATQDEVAWCSSFVNWCIQKAGGKGTRSVRARSWLKWGKPVDVPQKGDVVIFSRPPETWTGHVAFFISDEGATITVLGGNQSNKVKLSKYDKTRLLGYRRGLDG